MEKNKTNIAHLEKSEIEAYSTSQITSHILALAHYVNDLAREKTEFNIAEQELRGIKRCVDILQARAEEIRKLSTQKG